MDDSFLKLLLHVHNNNPQEGPGSEKSTLKALSYAKDLPTNPKILDIGCGPGRHTITLAKETKGQITAIDIFDQYLKAVKNHAQKEQLENIKVINCPMENIDKLNDTYDLIWSEGAIYFMGFEKGLNSWKEFLNPKGYIAVTNISWLKENPPEELNQFWQENFPAINTIEDKIKIIKKINLQLINHFTLPKSDWLQYHDFLQKRMNYLKENESDNKELMEYIKNEEAEIEMYNKYSDYYGYEFFIIQKP
ncbi:class I SAM-dependent methyltransferase [Candidatus Margulisiibacteriota bacterium]